MKERENLCPRAADSKKWRKISSVTCLPSRRRRRKSINHSELRKFDNSTEVTFLSKGIDNLTEAMEIMESGLGDPVQIKYTEGVVEDCRSFQDALLSALSKSERKQLDDLLQKEEANGDS